MTAIDENGMDLETEDNGLALSIEEALKENGAKFNVFRFKDSSRILIKTYDEKSAELLSDHFQLLSNEDI
ncbi:hypothetical protein AB835_08280 [Candidatus Endobugula sertula]|uniref:Uncharacterized protein n=1 Tax=Candidatus Endobugula sertula TaxID=62101 RepID=A0A1D2QPT1_9GAMM|nr:hypothetical protein AB835_08280 [Candidatus Endobugula sertula]